MIKVYQHGRPRGPEKARFNNDELRIIFCCFDAATETEYRQQLGRGPDGIDAVPA